MARVKGAVRTRARHKKILKLAKGYFGAKGRLFRTANQAVMKSLNYGKDYRYAHNEPEAFAKGVKYFPEAMDELQFYEPVDRGLEIKIKEKLQRLKELNVDH